MKSREAKNREAKDKEVKDRKMNTKDRSQPESENTNFMSQWPTSENKNNGNKLNPINSVSPVKEFQDNPHKITKINSYKTTVLLAETAEWMTINPTDIQESKREHQNKNNLKLQENIEIKNPQLLYQDRTKQTQAMAK